MHQKCWREFTIEGVRNKRSIAGVMRLDKATDCRLITLSTDPSRAHPRTQPARYRIDRICVNAVPNGVFLIGPLGRGGLKEIANAATGGDGNEIVFGAMDGEDVASSEPARLRLGGNAFFEVAANGDDAPHQFGGGQREGEGHDGALAEAKDEGAGGIGAGACGEGAD